MHLVNFDASKVLSIPLDLSDYKFTFKVSFVDDY